MLTLEQQTERRAQKDWVAKLIDRLGKDTVAYLRLVLKHATAMRNVKRFYPVNCRNKMRGYKKWHNEMMRQSRRIEKILKRYPASKV